MINEIEIRSDSLRFHIKILYFTRFIKEIQFCTFGGLFGNDPCLTPKPQNLKLDMYDSMSSFTSKLSKLCKETHQKIFFLSRDMGKRIVSLHIILAWFSSVTSVYFRSLCQEVSVISKTIK